MLGVPVFEEGYVVARGLALGFAIAATFGPIGVLCLRRTLAGGFLIGFASGLGAATADAAYAAVAAFGLSALMSLLIDQVVWVRVVGGAFLVYVGVQSMRAQPARASDTPPGWGLMTSFASTLGLTLSNPMTILSFVGIFAGLGVGADGGALLVAAVFVGSAAWWVILAGTASHLRERLTPRVMRAVNLGSGLSIAAFGVAALATQFGLYGGG